MKKDKPAGFGILIPAIVLVAALLISTPVVELLNELTSPVTAVRLNWAVPFRLVMMVSFLMLLFGVSQEVFRRWTPTSNHGRTMFTLANSAVRYVLVIVGLLWGLALCGVNVQALLAGAGVVALIIGFGAESLIADVITGIFMLFEHQYEVGDIIVVGDFRGTVTQIGIRATSITDTGGNVKIINNSDIRDLINRSSDSSVAVCDLGVLYDGESVRRAEAILAEKLPELYEAHRDLFSEPPTYLGVQELSLAQNAAVLRVIAKVNEANIYACQRVMNRDLMLALEDAGVGNPPAELVVKQVH